MACVKCRDIHKVWQEWEKRGITMCEAMTWDSRSNAGLLSTSRKQKSPGKEHLGSTSEQESRQEGVMDLGSWHPRVLWKQRGKTKSFFCVLVPSQLYG